MRVDPDEVALVQSEMHQAGQMRALGRAHQRHRGAVGDHAPQRWSRQPPFGQRELRQQDLGQLAGGPAAAGQFGVERVEAAGPDDVGAAAQRVAAPERLGHRRSNGGRVVIQGGVSRSERQKRRLMNRRMDCVCIQYRRPTAPVEERPAQRQNCCTRLGWNDEDVGNGGRDVRNVIRLLEEP